MGLSLLRVAVRAAVLVAAATSTLLGAHAAPPESPGAQAPAEGTVTLDGTFTLLQRDSGCSFADAPVTAGRITLTVDFTGQTVTGRLLDGQGQGERDLTCSADNTSGHMSWRQTYSATFSGTWNPLTGQVNVSGPLTGANQVRFSNCMKDRAPVTCASLGATDYSGSYSLTIVFRAMNIGTADGSTFTGAGDFEVTPIRLSTLGQWTATGLRPALTPTRTLTPTASATATRTPTVPATERPTGIPSAPPTATEVPTAVPTPTPPPAPETCPVGRDAAPPAPASQLAPVRVAALAQQPPLPVGCPRPPIVFAVVADEVDRPFVQFVPVDASSIRPASLDAAMDALEAATRFGTQIKQLYFVGHGGAEESLAGRVGAIEIGGRDYTQADFEALKANRPGLARAFAPGATVTLLNCAVGQDEAFMQAVGEAFLGVNGGLIWAKTGDVAQWDNFLVFGGYYIDTPDDPAHATNLAWFLGSGEWRSWLIRPEGSTLPRFERFPPEPVDVPLPESTIEPED